MNYVAILVILGVLMGAAGLAAFLWSLNSHQYDDLEGDAGRILEDRDDSPIPVPGQRPSATEGTRSPAFSPTHAADEAQRRSH